jgi:hypothetical protein
MAESAAEHYANLVHATETYQQQMATRRAPSPDRQADRWKPGAQRYREDPFRMHDTLEALLSYIEPADTVLDIGGGAGRYLPLALRAKDYVNVEPSPGMGAQFEVSVREAGIENARWLHSDWLGADIGGDVCFSANVVYYIADIVPFLAKLHAASRRRVMIVMHSIPPRNRGGDLARYLYGEEPPGDPGHRELLPVLWDMNLLPDVRVLGPSDFIAERERYTDRAAAIQDVVPDHLEASARSRAQSAVDEHFDELFEAAPDGGYRRRPPGTSRVLLITWETPGVTIA